MGLLQGLDLVVGLLVQGFVAAPGVVQQLLLGGVKLPNLSYLLGGHQEHLCNGGGGCHGVAVHSVALKCLGHGSKTLVGVEDLLVAKEYTVRVFHCGGRESYGGVLE